MSSLTTLENGQCPEIDYNYIFSDCRARVCLPLYMLGLILPRSRPCCVSYTGWGDNSIIQYKIQKGLVIFTFHDVKLTPQFSWVFLPKYPLRKHVFRWGLYTTKTHLFCVRRCEFSTVKTSFHCILWNYSQLKLFFVVLIYLIKNKTLWCLVNFIYKLFF